METKTAQKYQVFISSTYNDLQEERFKVMQTIVKCGHLPAGMENFPAIDQDQFEYIKKIIDNSDYYILIIGGRYGTPTADGKSYTEKEYDYAIQKGIKVMAFIHNSPGTIPLDKSEPTKKLRHKLETFKKKVSSDKLVQYWNKADDLPDLVSTSLFNTISAFPAVGWIRGNQQNLSDNPYSQIFLSRRQMHNDFGYDAKYAFQHAEKKAIFICFNAINLLSSGFRPDIIEALKKIDIQIFLIDQEGGATALRNTEMFIKDHTTPSDMLISLQKNFKDFMNHPDIAANASHRLTLFKYREMPYFTGMILEDKNGNYEYFITHHLYYQYTIDCPSFYINKMSPLYTMYKTSVDDFLNANRKEENIIAQNFH